MGQPHDAVRGLDAPLGALVAGALRGEAPDEGVCARILADHEDPDGEAFPLLPLVHAAGVVRRARFGNRVQVHMLHNVQNGACPEDCGYCGQAKTSEAPIQPYRLKPRAQIIAEAQRARDSGAFRYCMVLSGRGPSDADIEHMASCVREVKERFGLETCVSAGLLTESQAGRLKEAGLDRLNHNLNTSRGRYPKICSTHTYDDRVRTLGAARGAGLELCSGLIVGMGEEITDLVEVALALRELGAESIPVNFLVPIPGAKITAPTLAGRPLSPERCLRALCMMRFVNPRAEVRVAAGRETHLRSHQPLALEPANSLFVDGYLLTKGSSAAETIRMILDAGFELDLDDSSSPELLREIERVRHETRGGIAPDLAVLKEATVSARKLAKRREGSGAEPRPAGA